jgi:uncharacterized protein
MGPEPDVGLGPGVPVTRRSVAWLKDAGAELAHVALSERRLSAVGTAIGADPLPYRLDYELATADRYVTARLRVRAGGAGWHRSLELVRDQDGSWRIEVSSDGDPGHDLPPPGGEAALEDALDCDLGLSPLTNTMPVLRHGLLRGPGQADLVMAWVSVPDLGVHALPQRYTHVRRDGSAAIVRFDSEGFSAEIVFDDDGLVVDYPGIARRAGGP